MIDPTPPQRSKTARARRPSERAYRWASLKGTRRPCATPGCPKKAQAAERCSLCRAGAKHHLRGGGQP